MLFPDSFIDELKQRLPLSKVIASRIKLQRKGGAQYLGLCPFHQEKTPSFNVNDQKAMYYCFGCHAHGDLISFITETEKISFADAVKYLANFAGMSLPKMDRRETEKLVKDLYEAGKSDAKKEIIYKLSHNQKDEQGK